MSTDLDSKLTYDSHVHFFGVGLPAVDFIIDQTATRLNLPAHLSDQELIRGFGWSKALPLKAFDQLCKKHPEKKFCLSYEDGHSSFISQNLLAELKFKPKNGQLLPSGAIISEVERDQFYKLTPSHAPAELEKMAIHAQQVFLENKITNVRHLTGNIDHWHCLQKMKNSNTLELEIEIFFSEFMGQSLDTALEAFNQAQKDSSKQLAVKGLKIFYDGSFGSDTAYTSSNKKSKARLSKDELIKKMEFVLIKNQIPLAVHTIGDLALEDIIFSYNSICKKNKNTPELHLEHAPVFTQKTLDLLEKEPLNCIFHFQPSHWIQDQQWYSKNQAALNPHEIYPFDFLDKNNYEYHFGSDAPVVAPTKENTLKGLSVIKESKN
ncbi:MAG: amidohydrolase family protein [Bdellovibrionales bacterium]